MKQSPKKIIQQQLRTIDAKEQDLYRQIHELRGAGNVLISYLHMLAKGRIVKPAEVKKIQKAIATFNKATR